MSQHYWQDFLNAVAAPFRGFFVIESAFSLIFLASAFVFCAGIYALRAKRRLRWRTLRRFILPKRILLHPSARLDYRFYFFIGALRAGMLGAMVISSGVMAALVAQALGGMTGLKGPLVVAPFWLVATIATLVQIVLFDLGYWIGHRIMHEIPLLWEFHKPHHAAEVLTPATAARAHPVEDLLQSNFIAAALGVGYGFLVFAFGETAQPLTLFQTNIVFFIYFLTIFHLRHSHVWLPIKGWLGYIIQSPAHHQIHHSTEPRHYGKNLGFSLSFWDWLFGTLYVPNEKEELEFGLGHESAEFATVRDLFLKPFEKVYRLLGFGAKPATADVKPDA